MLVPWSPMAITVSLYLYLLNGSLLTKAGYRPWLDRGMGGEGSSVSYVEVISKSTLRIVNFKVIVMKLLNEL